MSPSQELVKTRTLFKTKGAMMSMMDETKKIGVGLTAFGVIFLVLGVMLFFDAALLALGNILFISGVMLIIGLKNTGLFFWRRMRGSVCFIGGMLLVLFGWPIFGMMLEIFGIINLFANFFPLAFTVLQGIPCFAWVGRLKPAYEKLVDRFGGAGLPSFSK